MDQVKSHGTLPKYIPVPQPSPPTLNSPKPKVHGCSKTFVHESSRVVHNKAQYLGLKFTCGCGYESNLRNNLKKHIKICGQPHFIKEPTNLT